MAPGDEQELSEWEQRAQRLYGPARLSRGARALMWLLRVYVVAMLALVIFGFARQLR